LIRYYLILALSFSLLSACDLAKTNQQTEIISTSALVSSSCNNNQRLLNPDSESKPSETDLDRYFRLAFNAETEGNFDVAIAHYQKAAETATCECDRKHALAGKQAAQEAKDLFNRYGIASKPTQFFWSRLQELTKAHPCVQIQE
jgi:hypothetical protein